MSNITFQLFAASTITAVFTVLLGALFIFYRTYRDAHYNQKEHRAELEMLRDSFERKIYSLTDKLTSDERRWNDLNHLLVSRLTTQPDLPNQKPIGPISQFLQSYNLTTADMNVDRRLVFVLTPFNKQFQEPFDAIAKACREVGFQCMRGDEEQVQGDLLPHILRLIAKARVIIANIDGRNPNVFYELGIAHALDKVTILVTKSLKSAPFDLRSKKLVVYQEMDDLRRGIQNELTRILAEA